jgi:hypothetical protein
VREAEPVAEGGARGQEQHRDNHGAEQEEQASRTAQSSSASAATAATMSTRRR